MEQKEKVFRLKKSVALTSSKPNLYAAKKTQCPFCDFDTMKEERLLGENRTGEVIWVENKFPNLSPFKQTLIIENTECKGEYSKFTVEETYEVLRFIGPCYEDMKTQGFEEVLVFKNYGPLSGGSVPHAHIHVVGSPAKLETNLTDRNFGGNTFFENNNVLMNFAKYPVEELIEINLISKNGVWDLETALYLKKLFNFIMNAPKEFRLTQNINVGFDYENARMKIIILGSPRSVYPLFYNVVLKEGDEYFKKLGKAIVASFSK